MKLEAAMDIIYRNPPGFRVSFEWIRGGMLHGDFFPDINEPTITT